MRRLKWQLLGWASKHPRYWHLAYPRTYRFVEWCVPPHNMGFRYWLSWAFRKERESSASTNLNQE